VGSLLRRAWTRAVVSAGYYRGPRFMSALRKLWVRLRNPHADIRFGKYTYLGPGFSLHMPNGGTFITGQAVEFRRKFRCEVMGDAVVKIGDVSVFTYDVVMQCGKSIEIGERVMFGQCTLVVDGNHRFRELDKPMLTQGYDFRPLRIADDATITTKCTIINDVGTRAFIGANSVVSREIPPYCLAAGNPARVIDYFGPPGQEPSGWDRPPSELAASHSAVSGLDAASSQASRKGPASSCS
jgi:acetyltransferase-like isoleucine patch superfamily enzyme